MSPSPCALTWARSLTAGDAGRLGGSTATAVAIDGEGNVIVLGTANQPIKLDDKEEEVGPYSSLFVAKYTADGSHIWSSIYGTYNTGERGASLYVDAIGTITLAVAHRTGPLDFGGGLIDSPSIVVARLDKTGAFVWSTAMPALDTGTGALERVTPLSNGDVLITGVFASDDELIIAGKTLKSQQYKDVFMARISATGEQQWGSQLGSTFNAYLGDVAPHPSGGFLICGSFQGSFDFAGDLNAPEDAEDIFVTRMDANGALVWAHSYSSDSGDRCSAITASNQGDITFSGDLFENIDFGGGLLDIDVHEYHQPYVVRLDAAGNHLWSQAIATGGDTRISDLVHGASNSVILLGTFEGTTDFGGGALNATERAGFLLGLTPSGVHQFSQGFVGPSPIDPEVLSYGDSGDIAIAGTYRGAPDLGYGAHTDPGGLGWGAFVALAHP